MQSSPNEMLSCHRVVELLLVYQEGELKEKVRSAMDQHFEVGPADIESTRHYRATIEFFRKELTRPPPKVPAGRVLAFPRKNLDNT